MGETKVKGSDLPRTAEEELPSARQVADRLDIMAIRIEHEGCIVVGMVVGPNSWCAVVARTGGQCGGIKGIHRLPVFRSEGNVEAAFPGVAIPNPELGPPIRTIAAMGAAAGHLPRDFLLHRIAERCENPVVEGTGMSIITNRKAEMVDHCILPEQRLW